MGKRKNKTGRFIPSNPHKYVGDITKIRFLSLWELKLMRWCNNNSSVIKWGSEIIHVPYYSRMDARPRKYMVDFIVKQKNIHGVVETLLIEVKPHKETIPPKKTGGRNAKERYLTAVETWERNQDKWKAATQFAKENNMKFVIMDEYHLGIKKRPKNHAIH